jgi:para-nitrobenzyl esterase
MVRATALVIMAMAGAPARQPAPQLAPPQVALDAGLVQGLRVGPAPGDVAFLGIPFAAPPVGARRWAAPQPVAHWSGVRRADSWPPICPQPLHQPEYFDDLAVRAGGVTPRPAHPRTLSMSEDCLTLSVWTTRLGDAGRRPVFVWVHGGGNVEGWNTQGLTDGMFLARKGIVVVSIEYRVGALGFLGGNYGLLDQIAGLQWVQRNIAAFGGDPARVTVGGQSSGAEDVACLLASPLARGLFRGAILESGVCGDALARVRADDGHAERQAALRRVPADSLVAAGWDGDVVVDGRVLPDQPSRLFDAGRVARVPVLVGTNADEMRSLGVSDSADAEVATDAEFGAPARGFARAMARRGAPVYVYYFTHVIPTSGGARLGAFHTGEMPFVFGSDPGWPRGAGDDRLRDAVSGYWVRFIQTLNPNGPALPTWPRYDSVGGRYLELGDTLRPGQYLRNAQYDQVDQMSAEGSRQLLVVVTGGWDDIQGVIYRFERDSMKEWRPIGRAVPVVVGSKGLAWDKHEGDGRSPAGIFPLGTVFGFAAPEHALAMPFRLVTPNTECVDDARSARYNTLVERQAQSVDWASSEQMRAVDPGYRIGVVIDYNGAPSVPGRGSCVFMHIWSEPTEGTAGCTAMAEPDIRDVVSWLDRRARPVIVQLPRTVYEARRSGWRLPELP